jgi:hypothetical protein
VELAEARCALTPPPRFLRLAKDALLVPMAAGIVNFTRVALGTAVDPRLFSVFRLPDRPRIENVWQLETFAQERARQWESEMVREINARTKPLPPFHGRPAVSCLIDFQVMGRPSRAAQCWAFDQDGSILRLESTGDCVEFDDLLGEAEGALRSLRTLGSSARPWWRFWS